ncbi:MAG: ABC transporter substrate-binding protein [Deltaproteobacteria bacterium]|jgi:ABC-type Fe3+-hydroxamate transport system substrate-binding protein|nr:ABC transporter substrate-binding protein [Deltaproteobacteria bacterium]MBT6432808.1 ABC transporter substrate-binding protein [Deltaproteobacteria bacterium]MBT6488954.1 ABC transporter substrate-binding protein [Deltaproteobacteria bacterium]
MAAREQKSLGAWFWVITLAVMTVASSYGMMSWLSELSGSDSLERAPEYQRIVSLSPALTQTLVLLGAANHLVGISDYCDEYDELKEVKRVGTGLTPNYESIVGLKPDLILLETTKQADYKNLEAITQTQALTWLTLDDVTTSTRLLGEMTNNSPSASDLSDKLSSVLHVEKNATGPRVLLLLGLSNFDGGSLWYIKRNSLHGAGLHAAGALNAVDKDISGAPSMSLEELLKIDPDMIITMISQPEFSKEDKKVYAERLDQLGTLKAVQTNKIGFLVGKELMGTGPGILDFVEALKLEVQRVGKVQP